MLNYVYKNGKAIGYLQGDQFIEFTIPIKQELLLD